MSDLNIVTNAVHVENLSVYYGQTPAITGVCLDVDDGEYLGIIGPNGGGKSTLLKAILYLMISLTFIVILVVIVLFNDWKAYLFDEEFASIIGIKTAFLEYLLMVLIAMTVVVLIRMVGIILVLALLTAPAAIAGMLSSILKERMIYAVIFGNIFCITGLWISYMMNIASGASIVILSVGCYFLAYISRLVFTTLKIKNWLNV